VLDLINKFRHNCW